MLEERSSSVHKIQHASFATEPSIADTNSTNTSSDTRRQSITTTLCGTDREARRDTPDTSLAEVPSLANGKERGGHVATGEARDKKKETSREMSLKHLKVGGGPGQHDASSEQSVSLRQNGQNSLYAYFCIPHLFGASRANGTDGPG